MEPSAVTGQSFTGTIKSYSGQKGYGFVVSDSIAGDLFFVHKNLPKEVMNRTKDGSEFKLEGKDVSFTVDMTPEGKALATDMQPLFELPPPGPRAYMMGKGSRGGKGKGKGYGRGWDMWWDWGFWGKGYGKGKRGRGGKGERGKKGGRETEPGTPLLDSRAIATVKSYSNDSKWGFATMDPTVGDFGDVFVHLKNLDETLQASNTTLREGDLIEVDLEEVDGKPVAKNVSIVPQDPALFMCQWLKGIVTEFNETSGVGTINCPRVRGDISFTKEEIAPSMIQTCSGAEVMFRLVLESTESKAKIVNLTEGLDDWEAVERTAIVVDTLQADGYIDDAAATQLKSNKTNPMELIAMLPELDFYKADNASSFILGALSRHRKAGKGSWGKGWGKGWGWGPY